MVNDTFLLSILETLLIFQIGKLDNQEDNHHYCFINVHYGIYRIINSNLFRYPTETVKSKSDLKKKRGVNFGNEREKIRKD